MKKVLITLLLVTNSMFSQSFTNYKEQLKNIAPSSPQAASFIKYGEIPVSLYTGIPDISIPLYTIKDKGIEVPIVLSYHASGIKVDEEATFVGLGWSLSSGGSVIQNIANRNDFGYGGYYFEPENTFPKLPIIVGQSIYNCEAIQDTDLDPYILNFPTEIKAPFLGSLSYMLDQDDNSCLGGILSGQVTSYDDFEPDLFLINTPNKTFKAYLDRENSILQNKPVFKTVGQHNIKIDFLGNYSAQYGNLGFNVTTDDGIKYEFTEKEIRKSVNGAAEINSQTSYLTKIKGIYANEINFSYINSSEGQDRYRGSNTLIDTKHTSYTGYLSCFGSYGSTKYIDEINFSEGKVKFSWSSREDLKNSKKLDKLEVFDKNGILIRKFDFVYSYFISNDAAQVKQATMILNNLSSKNPVTHRLKLLELKDSNESQSHKFEYEENIKLPAKTSFAVDFWGYYNGQSNDSTFIPNTDKFLRGQLDQNKVFTRDVYDLKYNSMPNPNTTNMSYVQYGWKKMADRRASISAKANIIKKIIYPTKGYTEFEFESNTFSNYPIMSLINENTLKNDYLNFFIDVPYFNNYNGIKTYNVTDDNTTISLNIKFDFWFQSSLNNGANTAFWVYIKDLSTGIIIKKIYNPNIGAYSQAVVEETIVLNQGNYEIGYDYNTMFSDHLYNVIKAGSTNNENPIYVNTYIVYSNKTNIVNNINYKLSYGGGLRIKKMITNDGFTSLTKEYIYDEMINNEMISNGKLMELPSFYKKRAECIHNVGVTPLGMELYRIESCAPAYWGDTESRLAVYDGNSNYGSSTTSQGNFVGYSKVIEKINDGSNGHIERNYINKTNQDSFGVWTFGKYQYLENGNLLSEKYFKPDNTIVKEIINTYENSYTDPNFYYQIYGVKTMDIVDYMREVPQSFSVEAGLLFYYPINLFRPQLQTTTVNEYFNSSFIQSVTNNLYNSNHQIKEINIINPDNSAKTKIFYPDDVTSASSLQGTVLTGTELTDIQKLNLSNQHRVTEPIQTETYYNEELQSIQRALYKDWGNNLVTPETIQVSKGIGSLENRIRYGVMDTATGNPREVQQENGTRISYIWGYNGTQPVAKIENMAYASIPANLITAIESASNYVPNVTYSEANLLNALNALRADAALANAMVTTYTYRPLVGITSVTDPSGGKVTYYYDNFNRLQFVKDRDGNILSENQYHYRP